MLLSGSAMSERDQHGCPLRDDSFLLLLNAGAEPVTFTLPGEPWPCAYESVVDTAEAGPPRDAVPVVGTVVLGGRSLRLLRAPDRG
jgi:glycogen operon protein